MRNGKNKYEVGFKKPPKETQFKQGTSGNPKGRPKGCRNITSIVAEVANRQVTINEGSRTIKTSLKQAVVLQIGMKAAKGDRHAGREFLNLCRQAEAFEDAHSDKSDISERDMTLLKAMSKRLAGYAGGNDEDEE